MSPRFANLAEGGVAVAELLSPPSEAIVLAILPNGVPPALEIAARHGLAVYGVRLDRDDVVQVIELVVASDGAAAGVNVTGRAVIVVDDGVETGSAAHVVGRALRDAGAASLILAVAVCPREGEARLALLYDEIVAVDRPMVRRSLRWHYEDFDVLDEVEALRRLSEHDASLG